MAHTIPIMQTTCQLSHHLDVNTLFTHVDKTLCVEPGPRIMDREKDIQPGKCWPGLNSEQSVYSYSITY